MTYWTFLSSSMTAPIMSTDKILTIRNKQTQNSEKGKKERKPKWRENEMLNWHFDVFIALRFLSSWLPFLCLIVLFYFFKGDIFTSFTYRDQYLIQKSHIQRTIKIRNGLQLLSTFCTRQKVGVFPTIFLHFVRQTSKLMCLQDK